MQETSFYSRVYAVGDYLVDCLSDELQVAYYVKNRQDSLRLVKLIGKRPTD